jgi:hypothetical protein
MLEFAIFGLAEQRRKPWKVRRTFLCCARPQSQLEDHFKETIGCFDQVFLVLDAMDECKKDHREGLLPYIVQLSQRAPGKLNLFVTSRPEGDIQEAFNWITSRKSIRPDSRSDNTTKVLSNVDE